MERLFKLGFRLGEQILNHHQGFDYQTTKRKFIIYANK